MNRNDPQFYAGDFKAPDPEARSISLEDTSEFSRPVWARPSDIPVGQDELGNTVFQGQGGRTYITRPNPLYGQQRPEGGYVRSALGAIPPVEDWDIGKLGEAAARGAKAIGSILWDVVDTPRQVAAGERVPTIGDAVDVAGFSATGGMAGFGVPEGALRANVPMFRRKPPVEPTPYIDDFTGMPTSRLDPLDERINLSEFGFEVFPEEFNNLTFRDWNEWHRSDLTPEEFLSDYGIQPNPQNVDFLFDLMDNIRLSQDTWNRYSGGVQGGGAPNIAEFRSPVKEVLEDLEFPSKGLKGSQFLKELRDNPTIRNSEVAAMDLQIDPMKRYTREELAAIVDEEAFTVQALGAGPRHRSMQRQPVVDPEVDYEEIMINASRQGGKPMFEPKYGITHYDPNTIAHARVSIREGVDDWTGANQRYLLVEEMQSDLLQKGYKPSLRVDEKSIVAHRQQQEKKIAKYIKDQQELIEDLRTREPLENIDSDFLGDDLWQEELIKSSEKLIRLAEEIGPEKLIEIVNNPSMQRTFDVDAIIAGADLEPLDLRSRAVPPLTSTTESTRAIVQSIMAYADQNNVGEIVFPPLERIAAQRFTPGTEAYNKAIKPGSGFHQTYVTSLNKVLKELEKELGANAVRVSERPINYEPMRYKTTTSRNDLQSDLMDILHAQDLVESGELSFVREMPPSYVRDFDQRYGEGWETVSSIEDLEKLSVVDLPSTGISISIPVQQDLDFSRPRFYKGGLVTRTKQALGEI
jgi:hypothetical protein